MPDSFDGNGLQVKTRDELVAELETAFKAIYGEDINLDQNSPDGQLLQILAQAGADLRELLALVNAGFDPDQAEGFILDQRVALNGITRGGGTFTEIEVDVTTDRALNLVGLDGQSASVNPSVPNLYTVRDDAGTLFYLLDSQSPGAAGTFTYNFRAADLGLVEVSPNTVTTPVTVVRGIVSVNNPGAPLVVGRDEETDIALRTRRSVSQSIKARGMADGMQAALAALDGVVIAIVKENFTTITDDDGIPAHSIWAIVDGGDDTEIATTIKEYKSAGCGMKGAEEVDVPYNDGRPYIVKFDRPVSQDLWIRFDLELPGGIYDADAIKAGIVENIIFQVGQTATASRITAYVQGLSANYQITGMEISDDNATWFEIVETATGNSRFVLEASRISIT